MDPLEVLRAHVPDFPGYDGEHNRRLSDEFVRSYLGEALANASRANVPAEVQSSIDALLLRAAFADPKSFPAHGLVVGTIKADGEVAREDAATVELADRVRSADASSLAALLDEVTQTLDRRDVAMHAAAVPSKTT
jgi:hypothetical protein